MSLHFGKCPPPFIWDLQWIKQRLSERHWAAAIPAPMGSSRRGRTERWLLTERLLVSWLLGNLSSLTDSVDCISLFPWTLGGSQGLYSPHEGSTHKGTNIFGPRYFNGALPLDLPDFLNSVSLLIVYMDPTSAISNPLCKRAMKFAWTDDTTEGWEKEQLVHEPAGWVATKADHRHKEEGKTGLILLDPHTKVLDGLAYKRRNGNKLPTPFNFEDCFSFSFKRLLFS